MQVLLFMGQDFYPRSRFEDFHSVWARVPTAEEVAAAVRKKMEGENIFDLSTMRVDWVDVMDVDGSDSPPKYHWQVGHSLVLQRLTDDGYTVCWQDADGDWHGVRELVHQVSNYADLNFHTYVSKR